MTIATAAALRAAMKFGQAIPIVKNATVSTRANVWTSLLTVTGSPGAGTLPGTSTTAGVVPTDATAGFPSIDSFNGNPGFISKVELTSGASTNADARVHLADLLWKSGAHAFNAADTITAPPSFASRIPGGTVYDGLEIWVEAATTFTGSPDITITYTNELGVAGRTTGVFTPFPAFTPVFGQLAQMPLQAGDRGVQKIESVTSATATVGTFNVLVMRPLIKNIRMIGVATVILGHDQTGCPQIFDDSAIYPLVGSEITSTPPVDMIISVASG